MTDDTLSKQELEKLQQAYQNQSRQHSPGKAIDNTIRRKADLAITPDTPKITTLRKFLHQLQRPYLSAGLSAIVVAVVIIQPWKNQDPLQTYSPEIVEESQESYSVDIDSIAANTANVEPSVRQAPQRNQLLKSVPAELISTTAEIKSLAEPWQEHHRPNNVYGTRIDDAQAAPAYLENAALSLRNNQLWLTLKGQYRNPCSLGLWVQQMNQKNTMLLKAWEQNQDGIMCIQVLDAFSIEFPLRIELGIDGVYEIILENYSWHYRLHQHDISIFSTNE